MLISFASSGTQLSWLSCLHITIVSLKVLRGAQWGSNSDKGSSSIIYKYTNTTITDLSKYSGMGKEYPTMHYFGIPKDAQ